MQTTLNDAFKGLRARDPDDVLEAVFDIRRLLPEIGPEQGAEVAQALERLFYIDTNDRPDLAPAVEQAIKLAASLGPELIPQHLEAMRGVDFKALMCFARILSIIGADAVAPILDTCAKTEDPHLLVGAIYALAKIRDDSLIRALPLLLTHGANADPEIRGVAIRALGKIVENVSATLFGEEERRRIHSILMTATTDMKPDIRAKAVRSLGKLAERRMLDPESLAAARKRLAQIIGQHDRYGWDPAFIVRSEAEEALERLGKEAGGPSRQGGAR